MNWFLFGFISTLTLIVGAGVFVYVLKTSTTKTTLKPTSEGDSKTTSPATSPNVKVVVTTTKSNTYVVVGMVLLLLVLFGVVVFTYPILKNVNYHGYGSVFPYSLAVIVGCLVYYMRTKKEEKLRSALLATTGTAILIALWMYHGQLGALLVGSSSKVVGQVTPIYVEKEFLVFLIAPLMGLMSYYLSDRGYKRFSYALMITIATAVVIALWIHPEVLKEVVRPFGTTSLVEHAKDSSSKFAVYLAVVLFILAVLSGKLIEVIIGTALMLILWNCF